MKLRSDRFLKSHSATPPLPNATPPALDEHALQTHFARYAAGDDSVLPELTPALYAELRRIARQQIRREPHNYALPATAVVHEAYLRLRGSPEAAAQIQGDTHFVRLASRVMRHVLVDHARAERSAKRGGDADITSLDRTAHAFHTRFSGEIFSESAASSGQDTAIAGEMNLLDLDAALAELRRVNARQAEVVDLRFFGDQSIEATAAALGVSAVTVKRDWSVARLFLRQAMAVRRG
jgi:RNA polymerase sigma-70 factor, ECF subfamily